MLHSRSLAITLPGETEQRLFKAPLPERFIAMIKQLTTSSLTDDTMYQYNED
jgi:hypothetical protein